MRLIDEVIVVVLLQNTLLLGKVLAFYKRIPQPTPENSEIQGLAFIYIYIYIYISYNNLAL